MKQLQTVKVPVSSEDKQSVTKVRKLWGDSKGQGSWGSEGEEEGQGSWGSEEEEEEGQGDWGFEEKSEK